MQGKTLGSGRCRGAKVHPGNRRRAAAGRGTGNRAPERTGRPPRPDPVPGPPVASLDVVADDEDLGEAGEGGGGLGAEARGCILKPSKSTSASPFHKPGIASNPDFIAGVGYCQSTHSSNNITNEASGSKSERTFPFAGG